MMTNGWQVAKIGEVTRPIERAEEPQAGTTYRQIGVRLWGQGAYEREAIDGSQTKYKTLSRVESGDIIVNKIWARNGSVAVVTDDLAGCFGSGEFPTFTPDRNRLEPNWFHWMTKTRWFWDACDVKSQGTSGKNRIRPEKFLEIEIPLPPLAEQRRIVAHIEWLAARVNEAQCLREEASEEADVLLQQAIWKIFSDGKEENKYTKRLGDACDFQGGSQPPKSLFAYEPIDGYVRLIQIRDYKSDNYLTFVPKDSVTRFCTADDVMIGRYGPPVFQILRGIEGAYNVAIMKTVPDETVLYKDYLYYLLQEPNFHQKVVSDSQRTSGQTGIRKELLQDHITYVPPLDEQRRIVAYLDGLQAKVNALRELQSASGEELSAVMPSVLDKAFKGKL